MADDRRHAPPGIVARLYAPDVARLRFVGVDRREGLEIVLAPFAQDEPLGFEGGNHFFRAPNGLKPPIGFDEDTRVSAEGWR